MNQIAPFLNPGPFGQAIAREIAAHALDEYPLESCGLIAGGRYLRCVNVADDPHEGFAIDPAEYLAAERLGKLQAVVHSHRPDQGACPSYSDMKGQMASAAPWGIVVCDGKGCPDIFWWGDQLPRPALLGRTFRHGVTDCYSIIRDWFWCERGILIPDFPREDGWWNKPPGEHPNHYVNDFAAAGFRKIATGQEGAALAKVGDVICFAVKAKVPHHAGVYLGGGLMLHHPADTTQNKRQSVRDPVGRFLKYAVHWLRHKDLEA